MKRIKGFTNFIGESISLDHAKRATKIFLDSGGKQRYDEVFKGSDRLYYDFNEKSINKTPIELEVMKALTDNGYYLVDYGKGLAKKEGDEKNVFKVQKILIKFGFTELKNRVDSDPLRASSTKDNKKIVISRHGIDIAGQSTGRSWTSCKSLEITAGINNSRYVWSEIEEGGLVAYLIKDDDLNIENPIARIIIGVFINTEDDTDFVLYPDQSVYGNYKKEDFLSFVEDWCDAANTKISKTRGTYKLSPNCYNDYRKRLDLLSGENVRLNDLRLILDKSSSDKISKIVNFTISPDEIKGLIKFASDNKYEPSYFFDTISKFIKKDNLVDYINSNSVEDIKSDIKSMPKIFNAYLKSVDKLDSIDKKKARQIKEQISMIVSEDGTVEGGMKKFRLTLQNLKLDPNSLRVINWITKD